MVLIRWKQVSKHPLSVRGLSGLFKLNLWEVNLDSGDLIKDIGQQIHADMNDDLNDFRIAVADLAYCVQFGISHFTGMFHQGAGENDFCRSLGIMGRTLSLGGDFVAG